MISSKLMREEEIKIDLDTGGKRNSRFQRRKCLAIDSSEVKHEPRRRIKEKRLRENSVISVRTLIVSRRAKSLRRSHSKRRDSSFSRGLCHGCLERDHIRRDCRNKKACSTCNGPHPTILHDDAFVTKKEDPTKPVAIWKTFSMFFPLLFCATVLAEEEVTYEKIVD